MGDNTKALFGNGNDLQIYHNGTNSNIENFSGTLQLVQNQDDGDISFRSDDGSGGTTEYFRLDGGEGITIASRDIRMIDNKGFVMGTDGDSFIKHTGAQFSFFNDTGHAIFYNRANDKNFQFHTDDGSGGTTAYLTLEGSSTHAYFSNPGNVGIGTTSPSQKLEVAGTLGVTGSTTLAGLSASSVTTPLIQLQSDLNILNKAQTAYITLADRDTSGSEVVYNLANVGSATFAGSINVGNTSKIEKAQNTTQFDTDSFLRLHPSATTNSGGYTNMIFGTSTANNFGVAIGGRRAGTGDTSSNNNPEFSVRILNDSITGTEVLNINTAGNATFAGGVSLTGGALSISGDGSNAATLTESSAGILTIATVDALILDSADDITLDAGGNDIRLKVSGTEYAKFNNASSDLNIYSSIQDKDIKFLGNDGGSTITALTLDMSDGGWATFNSGIHVANTFSPSTFGKATFAGNVGIGTTSPAEKLTVSGDSNITGKLAVGSSAAHPSFAFYNQLTAYFNGAVTIDDTLTQSGGGTSSFSGSVGIGTTSPDSKLEVDMNDASGNRLGFTGDGSTTGAALWTNWTTGTSYLDFRLGGTTNTYTKMRITNAGNVGIGTTSPSAKLHVKSAFAGSFTYDTTADDLIVESNANGGITIATAAANTGRVIFASPDDATGSEISFNASGALMKIGTTTGSGQLVLQSGNGSEALRANSSGNIGIGTTSPGQKLEVNGTVKSSGLHVTAAPRIDATGTPGLSAAGQSSSPTQAQVKSGGNPDYYLSEPDEFLAINISGTTYVIPAYAT